MFKKKKKKLNVNLEEEVIIATSKDKPKDYDENVNVILKDIDNVEEIHDVNIIDADFEFKKDNTEELIEGKYTYFDNDPTTECAVDDFDEITVDDEIVIDDDVIVNKDEIVETVKIEDTAEELSAEYKGKDLNSFFKKSKKSNEKIKEKPVKQKKTSKRQENREREFTNIKDQRVFVFRDKRYTKVEDFIKYLNSNYLDIDKIAHEVLDDENFYGWLSKKSGVFDDSIKQFKEIKEKIEKK